MEPIDFWTLNVHSQQNISDLQFLNIFYFIRKEIGSYLKFAWFVKVWSTHFTDINTKAARFFNFIFLD